MGAQADALLRVPTRQKLINRLRGHTDKIKEKMMSEKKTIGDKIISIMSEIGWIKKEGRNDFHKYNYAKEADVVDRLRTLFIKNRIYPSRLSVIRSASRVEKIGETEYASEQVHFTMSLTDADSGETMTIEAPGTGFDKSDKAVYKAITGAQKYALLKAFLIPTGDDPEASNPEVQAPQKKWPTREERAQDRNKIAEWKKRQELEKTKAQANAAAKPTAKAYYPENDAIDA